MDRKSFQRNMLPDLLIAGSSGAVVAGVAFTIAAFQVAAWRGWVACWLSATVLGIAGFRTWRHREDQVQAALEQDHFDEQVEQAVAEFHQAHADFLEEREQ